MLWGQTHKLGQVKNKFLYLGHAESARPQLANLGKYIQLQNIKGCHMEITLKTKYHAQEYFVSSHRCRICYYIRLTYFLIILINHFFEI